LYVHAQENVYTFYQKRTDVLPKTNGRFTKNERTFLKKERTFFKKQPMNAILIQKVEELTLHILDLQKQINELKKEVNYEKSNAVFKRNAMHGMRNYWLF